MNGQQRRRSAVATIRAIDIEIGLRRRELGALERSRDIIEDRINAPECAAAIYSGGTICHGERHAGRCMLCGFVVVACDYHDGTRTIAKTLASHQCRIHRTVGATESSFESTNDIDGMPNDSPVPVGQLPLSSID